MAISESQPLPLNASSPDVIISYLKRTGFDFRTKDYESVVQKVKSFLARLGFLGLAPILGLLAAICEESQTDSDELYFYQLAEKMYYNTDDLPHFFHLIDELHVLPTTDRGATLLQLILGDTNHISRIFKRRVHLIPLISSDIQKLLRTFELRRQLSHQQADDESKSLTSMLMLREDEARSSLPALIPLGEGFALPEAETPKRTLKSKPKQRWQNRASKGDSAPEKVMELIAAKNWTAAISLATQEISAKPNNAEMYQHRAFALMHAGKVHDAITDCTSALKIHPSDDILKLRSALWLMLGEKVLHLKDLELISNKEFSRQIIEIEQESKRREEEERLSDTDGDDIQKDSPE